MRRQIQENHAKSGISQGYTMESIGKLCNYGVATECLGIPDLWLAFWRGSWQPNWQLDQTSADCVVLSRS